VQKTKPVEEKPKKSSFLVAPSSLGLSNLLFGQNENTISNGNGKAAENLKLAEKDVNQKKSSENTLSGNAKNFLSAGVGRVFKRTSDGQENRPEKALSPSDTPLSSSSFFSPFSSGTAKKDQPKLDESIADVCEFLSLLEICFMHGIRVKEFHGVLPLWTLLERLRLLTPQIVASMSVIDTNEGGGSSKSDINNIKKNESNKLGSEQEVKKNSNSKDNIMASIRNKFDHLSHHTEAGVQNATDNSSNSSTTEKQNHSKPTVTGTGTDNMTPVLTSNPLRQSVGAIASISALRSPVAKARAWIRCMTSLL
jgi:hypothetical protein